MQPPNPQATPYPPAALGWYSTILLAYAGGYCGILLSPLHFCLALTRQYFGSEWGRVYRIMGGPVALVFASALVVVALAAAF